MSQIHNVFVFGKQICEYGNRIKYIYIYIYIYIYVCVNCKFIDIMDDCILYMELPYLMDGIASQDDVLF